MLFRSRSRASVPAPIQRLIESSLGAALTVAHRAPKKLGSELATLARRAFVSGMDEALVIATAVVAVAALVFLPSRGLPDGAAPSGDEKSLYSP